MKTSLFETIRLFQYKDCQNCYHVSPAIQLLHIILRNFHCDAIILVVKLFWCVALELMTNSKCTPGQSQWALLKQESCGEVIKRLFSSAQHVSAQKAFLEENGCNADRIFRLQCHNFELTNPASWRSGKDIAVGAGGFGFGFWADTGCFLSCSAHELLVRTIWGSIPGPVKSARCRQRLHTIFF